tara:strand:- start:56 stop:337 length:282 start_codon:yes stop_codon:yes gene_type:complete
MPQAPEDTLVTIPDAVADHFDLDGASYTDGSLHIQGTAKVPMNEAIGKDAADILQMIADADEDKVFTKGEAKRIGFKLALAVARHYGLGNLLG